MEFEKIEEYLSEKGIECFNELEGDYLEEELNKMGKIKLLKYFIEFLVFEVHLLENNKKIKK